MLVEIKHIHPQMLMGDITVKPEKQNCWLKQNIHIHSGMRCSLHFIFNCLLVSMMSCAFCSPQTASDCPDRYRVKHCGLLQQQRQLQQHSSPESPHSNNHHTEECLFWKNNTQQGSPGPGLIPPQFTYANDVKPLGLGQSFQLVFVPHAVGIRVETFQVWYFVANTCWSRLWDPIRILKVWHKIPFLITGEPAFFPFPLPS